MQGAKRKNLAFRQYQKSKDRARYVGLAQKLAQHLNNLAEDRNSRIRWIWQLIQNAKDVPNQFGKCKIRIEIRDDKLIFAHNGDPFRVSDLESLVAQYSSKSEENKVNTETTGKYGTGFITTYILSRKVKIKGILYMKNDSEDEQKAAENKEKAKVKKDQSELDRFQVNEDDIHKNSEESRVRDQDILFQRFEIVLDRTYKDRDTELVEKLMETEYKLMEDLQDNQAKPKWQRKQDEYNTQFTYQQLDEFAIKMIEQSMSCLKELFPYALLFNPKLSELHVINKSSHKKIKNYIIKKVEEQDRFGLKLFNAKVVEEGKEPYTFSAAYLQDEDTFSTVAVPVSVEKDSIKLLETNEKYPKIFKEFPLIGCKDHGFNFVFTSRRFYPNETRSDLLLNQIEGRFSSKAKANWDSLEQIFSKGLKLYLQLAQVISQGQENLLMVILQNQFTCTTSQNSQQYKDNLIFQTLLKYQQELSKMKFIEFRDGKKRTLNELVFPKGKSQLNNAESKNYSIELNKCFSSIIGQNKTLANKHYIKFYPKLIQFSQTWKHSSCKYWGVKDCISELSKNTMTKLEAKFGNKQAVLDTLDQIYVFLQKYNPSFMTQNVRQEQQDENSRKKINFILTNKEQFKSLNSSIKGHPLMIKDELPKAYEEIAEQIGIDIDDYTIFDQFVDYFKKVKPFGIDTMLALYRQVFFVNYVEKDRNILPNNKQQTNRKNQHQIILLGRFLKTFGISTKGIELISIFKKFELINRPFKITDKQAKMVMKEQLKKQYRYLFELKVIRYINDMFNQHSTLLDQSILPAFLKITNILEKTQIIQWLNDVFELETTLVSDEKMNEIKPVFSYCFSQLRDTFFISNQRRLIDRNLSLSETFVKRSDLQFFGYKHEGTMIKGRYPTQQDIKFYEAMRQAENRHINEHNSRYWGVNQQYQRALNNWNIRNSLIHQKVNDPLVSGTIYEKVFQIVDRVYVNASEKQKLLIFEQVYRLRKIAIKNKDQEYKIKTFKKYEEIAYYQYPLLRKLTQPEHQIYAFHLLKEKEQIDAAIKLSEKYGSLTETLKKVEEAEEKIKEYEKK